MSDMIISSYTQFGSHRSTDDGETLPPRSSLFYVASAGDGPIAPLAQLDVAPMRDRTVAELAIRRLTQEIDYAKAELGELEQTVRHELQMPSVREWLLPLMAIGLALSFYGSFASANSAELGATGLMLLWSLSAFWFIYTREKRLEMAREANRAEIEIWSNRIEELQRSIEQTSRVVEVAANKDTPDEQAPVA